MAAKLLHSMADESTDLQKQIGCMTGIFQVFDRQHLLSGQRPNQRRLLPPPSDSNSKFSNGSLDADSSKAYNGMAVDTNPKKYVNEKQRASKESSRPSFSSSLRSSSCSSIDCGRTGQPERSSMDQPILPEAPSRDPTISQTSASLRMERLSVDLRDVVKDSIYKDSQGLSVQTKIKEKGSGHTLKHIDSPRPLQSSKSVNGLVGGAVKWRKDVPIDIKESLRVLTKLHDAPWHYVGKEISMSFYESNEGSGFSLSGDSPRLSYEGGEINAKNKDLPRLSLDIRESSARNQPRPSSIVAKLMGLDMLPASGPSGESHLIPIETFPVEDVSKAVQLPNSPRRSRKEPNSPHQKNPNGVMRSACSSKIPIEPAPWKHLDSSHGSPKQASRHVKQSDKDLKALEQILEAMQAKGLFDAAKDEQYWSLENMRDDDRTFGFGTNARRNSNDSCTSQTSGSQLRGSKSSATLESPIVVMKPVKLVQKPGTSPIISGDRIFSIQRPQSGEFGADGKNSVRSKMTKDHTVGEGCTEQATFPADRRTNIRNSKVAQSSSRLSQVTNDKSPNSLKNTGSISPRLQQKKLEFDKRSRSPTPRSDSNKTRQPNKQSTESGSPGGRRRLKTSSERNNYDQLKEKVNEPGSLIRREVSSSVHPNTHMALKPTVDIEVTSNKQPVEITCCRSQSLEAFRCVMLGETKNDMNLRLGEEDGVDDISTAPEQPSPVSVLDLSVYMEDSTSPVKQISHGLKGNGIAESNQNNGEYLWNTVDGLSTRSIVLELPSKINRKKLRRIDNLVQKLRRLNSTQDESQTDYIASLCKNANQDDRYISEILITSGLLLRDLSSSGLAAFQLHPSGHPINPELYFVLEQTKASKNNADGIAPTKSKPEKLQRQLVFDVVNEILLGKLNLVNLPAEPWLKPDKLAKKTLNGQILLKEICAEIKLLKAKKQYFSLEKEGDGLQNILLEDVMHRSDKWTDFGSNVSEIVLDVERSIFKELVNEIIIGEAAAFRGRPNRRCRQLFSN